MFVGHYKKNITAVSTDTSSYVFYAFDQNPD